MAGAYRSWGYTPCEPQQAASPAWRSDCVDVLHRAARGKQTWLPFGNGRSYGDSCLNSTGIVIDASALNRFVAFDRHAGLVTAEPGVTLVQILSLIVPQGWFLPVSPGTAHVTLGGAIANDVHGKNHHCDGTFGRFVASFKLLRSNGDCVFCSPGENSELYRATIGGLGLTGLIVEATVRLIPVKTSELEVRVNTFRGIDAFRRLSEGYRADYRYTVAWLDCSAGGREFGRGVFLAANHATVGPLRASAGVRQLSVPMSMPAWVLNRWSVRAFNAVYFAMHKRRDGADFRQHYQPFFYPLDAVQHWNRIYGRNGFYQYQFVVPLDAQSALESILQRIVASGLGSFLAVLKEFGDIESPGLMSFPRPGLCVALDFANRGARTRKLIVELDDAVMRAGGAAYPAKDRLMRADAFRQYYCDHRRFAHSVDPQCSSDFWRRVIG